ELPPPAAGEVRVRPTAISFNDSDVNVRRGGFYIANPLDFPVVLGNEAAGIVTDVGPGVSGVKPGDRVAYVGSGGPFYEKTGSYAEERNILASCLILLPATITDRQAAAFMLKGLTASLVINRNYKPKPGDAVLVHAAASGVGLVLVQWCKHLGATVIGTVGSRNKAEVVRAHGCDHTILYREQDFVKETRRIVPKGVAAVLDGVGKDTFEASLDCLRPFGILVNYGNASGHPEPLDLILLAKKGSLTVTRPAFSHHIADPADAKAACDELFDLVAKGAIKVEIGRTYPLRDAAQAHRDLEARTTSAGSVVFLP
ncbi:MAG: quinone oxidoreductase, partial [Hyphomicrobiaceae bacterium]